jgi:glucose/arabinose dehydrogenase
MLDKHAAAGAVAVVTGQLGPSVGTAALVSEWQAGRVMRVPLTKGSSTTTSVAEPLLTGVRNPLALATAPDGALFVGDWGTGRIYRIAAR